MLLLVCSLLLLGVAALLWLKDYRWWAAIAGVFGLFGVMYALFSSSSSSSSSSSPKTFPLVLYHSPRTNHPVSHPPLVGDDAQNIAQQLVLYAGHPDPEPVIGKAKQLSDAIASIASAYGPADDSIFSQKTLRSIGHAMNQLTLYFAPGQRRDPVSTRGVVDALDDTRTVVLNNKPPRSFFQTATRAALVGGVTLGVGYYGMSFTQTLFDTWVQGMSTLNATNSLVPVDPSSFTQQVWRLLSMSRAEMNLFWSMKVMTLTDLLPNLTATSLLTSVSVPVAHSIAASSSHSISLMKGPLDLLSTPIQQGGQVIDKARRVMKKWMSDLVQPYSSSSTHRSSSSSTHDELMDVVVGTFVILLVFGTFLYDYFGNQTTSQPISHSFGRKRDNKME